MAMQWRKDQPMTAAQWRLAREMHQKLCADAGISDEREEFRAWHFQNCKGALYKTMLGDNPPKRKFVEGHSIYQWLPGGENEDPELVHLLEQDDLEGFNRFLGSAGAPTGGGVVDSYATALSFDPRDEATERRGARFWRCSTCMPTGTATAIGSVSVFDGPTTVLYAGGSVETGGSHDVVCVAWLTQ